MVLFRYMSNKNSNSKNNYAPAPALVKFLDDKLRMQGHNEKLREAGRKEKLNVSNTTIRNSLSRRKVDIFDRHLFRSMASLTYFFEFLNNHPELTVDFENEIEELFGYKGSHMKYQKTEEIDEKGTKYIKSNQGENWIYCVFLRFITAILNTDDGNDVRPFRLYLINDLQYNLLKKMDRIAWQKSMKEEDEEQSLYRNVISNDISRCKAWIKYLIKDAESPSAAKPYRLANF